MNIITIIIIVAVFAGAIVFSIFVERIQNRAARDEKKKESEAKINQKK